MSEPENWTKRPRHGQPLTKADVRLIERHMREGKRPRYTAKVLNCAVRTVSKYRSYITASGSADGLGT